ncbi:redoxin family protein [Flavobacteriaceae bacterium R38]|nr:redoxin family protein [Flavobacteriaceae bacterium R38]
MKTLIFALIAIVFFNCKRIETPQTPEDLIQLSIEKTSNGDKWQLINTRSWNVSQTTTISGNIVNTTDMAYTSKFPGYERIDSSIEGALNNTQYFSPDKNTIVNYNGSNKGYTNIPEKTIYKTPVFELLNNTQDLILTDTLIGFENVYKLTNVENNNVYLFDKTRFLLISKETQTNYGRQIESFQDYEQINGYMFPTKVTRSIPESAYLQEEIVCDIKINPALDENTFIVDESDRKIMVGNTIPDFNFENIDYEEDRITNESLRGKTVLLDFWATWCGPCIKEIPNIETLYKKYKNKNFEVVSVSLDKDKRLVENFRNNQSPLAWKNTILTKGFKDGQAINMEVSALPKVILINPEGKIIAVDEEAKGEQLETLLANIYSK